MRLVVAVPQVELVVEHKSKSMIQSNKGVMQNA